MPRFSHPGVTRIFAWLALAACQQPPAAAPAPSPRAATPARTCPTPAAVTQHAAPETAYSAYADAINSAHWCDAIASFEDASRPRVAVANFKGLAMLAGAGNPKQREYAAALKQLCQRHALDCADDHWLLTFVPAAMQRANVQPQLAAVTRQAQAEPSGLYLEIMEALQGVDAAAMAHLDPRLANVDNRGDTAVGMAHQPGKKPIQISLVRTPAGWKLSMPQ
jgi:hypothetical protein